MQNKPGFEPGTYIGEGKANEIRLFCHDNDVDIAVFDDELTGTQIRNLEELLDVRVMDRSSLILDIFAQRAKDFRRVNFRLNLLSCAIIFRG